MKQLLLHLLSHLFTSLQVFQIASSFHFQASLSLSQRQRSVAVSVSVSVSVTVQEVPTLMNNNLRSPLRKKIKPPFQRASMALSTSADLKEYGKESKPKGPIYITIGPQCSGKTSFLSSLVSESELPVIDISIDDQKGVYLKIPTKLFLHDSPNDLLAKHNDKTNNISQSSSIDNHKDLLHTSVHNKTIADRICDASNDEMRLVVQRLCQGITAEEFREKAMNMLDDKTKSTQGSWQRLPTEEIKNITSSDQSCQDSNEHEHDWRLVLIQAVEEHIQNLKPTSSSASASASSHSSSSSSTSREPRATMSQHCQLFVVEGIFKTSSTSASRSRSRSSVPSVLEMNSLDIGGETGDTCDFEWPHHITSRNMSGLNAAISKLKHVANANANSTTHSNSKKSANPNLAMTPVAWGNTNSKARDYVSALEVAEYSKRPVYFVPYADLEYLNDGAISSRDEAEKDEGSPSSSTLFLPRIGIKTLVYRNVKRLIETGKYIPTKAIIDTTIRVSQLVQKASVEMTKQVSSSDVATQFDMDKVLVKMVGYGMRRDRTIYKLSPTNSSRGEGGGRGRGRGRGGGRGRNTGSSSGRGSGGRGGSRGNQNSWPSTGVSEGSIGGRGRGRSNGRGRGRGEQ
mmetsp:Transcript_17063/g.25700  ORF Transcript_17063/g.25700 Transcript_17063/m.25700 type:complete len:628 (+) Transcript_17063:82-1965(+)